VKNKGMGMEGKKEENKKEEKPSKLPVE